MDTLDFRSDLFHPVQNEDYGTGLAVLRRLRGPGGRRIDLTLFPIARLAEFQMESLSAMLLDEDGLVGTLPPPSARDFAPAPPTAARFADCCNAFW